MLQRVAAVVLNLFVLPGSGHHAIGRTLRGVPWLVLQALAFALVLVHPAPVLVLLPLVRVGSAIEVAVIWQEPHDWGRIGIALAGGVVLLGVLAGGTRAFLAEAWNVPSAAMNPTLAIGDHVFGSKLAYRLGEPERGDVAVFEFPCEPGYDYVKRIVALPGDTVEVRCDVLFVNGAAAPARSLKEECTYWDRDESWVKVPCVTYVEELDGRSYEVLHGPGRRDQDRLRAETRAERTYQELAGARDFPVDGTPPGCPATEPVGSIENAASPPVGDACAPRRHYVVPPGHVFVLGDNRASSADSRVWGPVPVDHLKAKVVSIWWSSGPPEDGVRWDRIGPLD